MVADEIDNQRGIGTYRRRHEGSKRGAQQATFQTCFRTYVSSHSALPLPLPFPLPLPLPPSPFPVPFPSYVCSPLLACLRYEDEEDS